MRLVHLSDLHITEGPRLADQARIMGEIVAKSGSPDLWLVTGDLYGKSVPHRSTPLERGALFPALAAMAEVAPVVVVAGNHDHADDIAGLEHLGGAWPVTVVQTARAWEEMTPTGSAHLYALPYPTKRWLLAGGGNLTVAESQAAIEARLGGLLTLWRARVAGRRAADPSTPHIGLGHFQVAGCQTSGGEVLAGQEIELTPAALESLDVDYGALGHLHLNQEVARRWWYVGSPWRTDFGEVEPDKYWHSVGIAGPRDIEVEQLSTGCRDLVTLDWRWAADRDGGAPCWVRRPTWSPDDVRGAEVRARLVVPEQWVAGCPWDDELAALKASGVHRLVVERVIEPVLRMRAPAMVSAQTLPEKLAVYWGTLPEGSAPSDDERAAALEALTELQTQEDDKIDATTRTTIQRTTT